MLYPVELQGQDLADGAGFEPARPVKACPLAGDWFQPLTHPSENRSMRIIAPSSGAGRQAGDQDVCGTYAQIARPPPCILML